MWKASENDRRLCGRATSLLSKCVGTHSHGDVPTDPEIHGLELMRAATGLRCRSFPSGKELREEKREAGESGLVRMQYVRSRCSHAWWRQGHHSDLWAGANGASLTAARASTRRMPQRGTVTHMRPKKRRNATRVDWRNKIKEPTRRRPVSATVLFSLPRNRPSRQVTTTWFPPLNR